MHYTEDIFLGVKCNKNKLITKENVKVRNVNKCIIEFFENNYFIITIFVFLFFGIIDFFILKRFIYIINLL